MKKMMRAFRLDKAGQPATVQDVPIPEPGPGQVLVKIAGSGACHSDLHLMEGMSLGITGGFILGHENAGWIAKLGDNVGHVKEGDAVVINAAQGCGVCSNCRIGWDNYCEHWIPAPGPAGLGSDGGMAEYMLVRSDRWLVPLQTLDPRDAAPLTDAGATSYHAVKRALPHLVPGSTALVIGIGGLGGFAVQLVRATSAARVIAVDRDPDKVKTALELGAHEGHLMTDDLKDTIKAHTQGRGVDATLDIVGSDATLALSAAVTRRQGQILIVGLDGGTLPVKFRQMPLGTNCCITMGASISELAEVVALAEEGRLKLRSQRFPLDKAPEVYELMHAGKMPVRAVITPNG